MERRFLAGKIHRAIVTSCNVDYEGSISLDPKLMRAAGIASYEQVHVYNVTNGNRLVTYAIPGSKGEVGLNGAAARLFTVGDLAIVISYLNLQQEEIDGYVPTVVLVDAHNAITYAGPPPSEPAPNKAPARSKKR